MSELRRRIMMQQAGGGGNLPDEYQQVEYLGGTGTQYINTGILLDGSDKIRLIADRQYTRQTESYFAVRQNGIGDIGLRNGFYNRRNILDWYYSASTISNFANSDIQHISAEIDAGLLDINSGEILINRRSLHLNFTIPLFLFAMNNNGSMAQIAKCSIEFFEVEGKCKLIPCYRKSDNVAGMYDRVNGVFYTNAGTGSFIVGADVN